MDTLLPNAGDRILTVHEPAPASILISGSKFIAIVAPAAKPDDAEESRKLCRRRYPDATHHCWAYRVGRPGPLAERSSDAGEPSGTAGRPIADALRGASLENVSCVVTRYFGGTKLGTGGLVRAYADATRAAIDAARIVERTIVRELNIEFDHQRTGVVYRVLEEFGLHLNAGTYDTRARGQVSVPASQVDRLTARMAELALSGIELEPGELSLH